MEHIIGLAGVVVGSFIAVVAGWLQVRWQERTRKSGEKRARTEARFEEIREYLAAASQFCRAESELWDELLFPEPGEAAGRRLAERIRAAEEKLIGTGVGAAPDLFVQNGEALEKLLEIERTMAQLRREDFVDERAPVMYQKVRRVQELSGEIQRRLDELMDEM